MEVTVVHAVAEAEPPAEENVEECSADAAKGSGGASSACGLYGPAPHAQSPPPVMDTCGAQSEVQARAEAVAVAPRLSVTGAVLLVPKLDGSWEPLFLEEEPTNPFHAFVRSRGLTGMEDFYTLWAEFQASCELRYARALGAQQLPQAIKYASVDAALMLQCGQAQPLMAMAAPPADVLGRIPFGSRGMSSRDTATGGAPRPPPDWLVPAHERGRGGEAHAQPEMHTLSVPMGPQLVEALRQLRLPMDEAAQYDLYCVYGGGGASSYLPPRGGGNGRQQRQAARASAQQASRHEACYFWQRGGCSREACRFSHEGPLGAADGAEAEAPPAESRTPLWALSADGALHPPRICQFWRPGSRYGSCKKGATCDFLHI